jgi:cell division protein FtsZ
MTGKIRVSIVATALDGHKSENKTVLNMVSRIQNRNTGYSDSLFSHNTRVDSNALSSIDGATALKLDESYEVNEDQNAAINFERNLDDQTSENNINNDETLNDITSGVSMENAAYMENNINEVQENINNSPETSNEIIEEYTPKLFSEEQSFEENEDTEIDKRDENDSVELFDQDTNEEEDFEIPAFLRKQKF